jgi:hypothetical protein
MRILLKYLILAGSSLLASCTSFDHLTQAPATGDSGPKASECGTCHGAQYREWQGSVHAQSFTSTAFQAAAGIPPEAECLQCHSSLGMRDNAMVSRSFNQHEGVTCVSCHLVEGSMHGPHGSTALVSPHRIQEDRATYTSPSLCANCHGETVEQWHKATARQQAPTCQQCHQAVVERTVTQGTNFFSNMLVAFEKKVSTRSHDINLEHMTRVPDGISLTIAPPTHHADETSWEVTVRNNLPHDLPTGTYGEKELRLVPVVATENRRLSKQSVLLGKASQALTAGESKKLRITLKTNEVPSGPLRLDVERHSPSHAERNPIVLATAPIPSTPEALP